MTTNTMEYKGFIAIIEYSAEDKEFFGKVTNAAPDRMIFGGKTVKELEKHMKETVNAYLEWCEEEGTPPYKSRSGRITLRTTQKQHDMLAKATRAAGKRSMNEFIMEAARQQAEKILENRV